VNIDEDSDFWVSEDLVTFLHFNPLFHSLVRFVLIVLHSSLHLLLSCSSEFLTAHTVLFNHRSVSFKCTSVSIAFVRPHPYRHASFNSLHTFMSSHYCICLPWDQFLLTAIFLLYVPYSHGVSLVVSKTQYGTL
jgi:hypothetical protein